MYFDHFFKIRILKDEWMHERTNGPSDEWANDERTNGRTGVPLINEYDQISGSVDFSMDERTNRQMVERANQRTHERCSGRKNKSELQCNIGTGVWNGGACGGHSSPRGVTICGKRK